MKAPALVFAAAFTWLLFLAAPGLTWFDGGELAAAAATMGVAHPPGEPAWLVPARIAALLPLGDLPFRLTVISALTVAGAAAVVSILAAGIGARAPGAALAGLLFAATPAATLQGVRPEVYGLQALLVLAGLLGFGRGDRRGAALAVIPLCLAGAVHHALLVAAVPAILVLAIGGGRRSLAAGAAAAVALIGPGLGQFAWLPLRAATWPSVDFGHPVTASEVLYAVSGQAYARSFGLSGEAFVDNLIAHGRLFLDDVGLVGLALALLGAAIAPRVYGLVAGLLVAVGVLPTALQGVFSATNPDARGYLLMPEAALCVLAGVGASWALGRLRVASPQGARLVAPVGVAATLLLPAVGAGLRADRRQLHAPHRLASSLLDVAPPGAIALVGGDSFALSAWYIRVWERRRPDVWALPYYQLSPAALESAARAGRLAPSAGTVGSPGPEHTLRRLLPLARAAGRPVLVNDAFVPPELLDARAPWGPWLRIDGGRPAPSLEERWWQQTVGPVFGSAGYRRDPVAARLLGQRYGARAGLHRSRGDAPATDLLLGRGSLLAVSPTSMIQLMRHRWEQGEDSLGAGAPPPGPWESLFAQADDAGGAALLAGEAGPDAQALRAAALIMAGRADEAATINAAVLAGHPTHPLALTVAERLYWLGASADAP